MPGTTIEDVQCWVLRAPIDHPVRSAFGVMADRPAVLVRLTAADGAWGWGEVFCNFPPVGAEHRGRLLKHILAPLAVGRDAADPAVLHAQLEAATWRMALQSGEPGPFAQVIAALDQAAWDVAARRAGLPLWRLLRTDGAAAAPVRAYASGLGPERVAEAARQHWEQGFRAFKLKVGFSGDTDLRNLTALRDAVGRESTLMVDANQSWGLDEARARITAMAPFGLAWVEEPLAADASLADWRALARDSTVPLAAGENLRGLAAFGAALQNGHLRYVQPDVAKWGGISGCREVARMAPAHDAVFCPHWLGGGIGLAASLQLRAAMGPDGYLEVDANPNPLRDGLCPPLALRDGCTSVTERPGIGVEPDPDLLQRYRVAI